ncbi:5,10-methylene tetrahydromethanopterin reductase [Phycicoccus sp. Root563]|uniref:LLM class flavin-dependent oxidoreductase n=1 Tax=Phycicoccus sp. Root563 TaxID=1736562 RepID=UPI000702C7CB|nr:LLM class flavin-dependent oxidoreductase [Phycicoccus sp. Root563]KQZ89732.1 5,10-methylene tetrahydromethanopterin reductase [Phycicoccus sp. Root563]
MTDYGHELEFGIFPSPDADRLHETLAMAEAADVGGLDLVTIQDHPYQAKHLDAWTLLSVIAARTTSVRVAPNVANLPLRPPVVLARSVATLDQLSGGRAELGLGTGAFWDAIVAAGGPRRTPGEAVEALEEAIAVIRALWSGRGSVTLDGDHYPVRGLHAGPVPAHDVGIWVGAYKPRMLRVTGRLADGWLPSLGYAAPETLSAMNATIDEAAEKAGRSPVDIRRLYNIHGRFGSGGGLLEGQPRDWAEQLAEITLDQGMSTYILAVSSLDDVERFAAEVAPLTRELVDTERARAAVQPKAPEAAAPTRGETLEVRATQAPRTDVPADVWDESTRPSAPVDPDERFTATQQATGQHLVDVHDHLRGELERLRDVVEQVAAGETDAGRARNIINELTMRQNNWTLGAYCASYCRVVTGHHTLEDRSVFPHLRHSDPQLAPVIDRLEAEHHVIHDVLEQVDHALVQMVSGEKGTSVVRDAVDLLGATLLSHLSYEERELIPALSRHGFS